ncbi:MBL fold metallo-hydrolase [Nocardioides sp. AE5]|uniref:MBL fold metallo-hydrolase n=1 Tax=Nocardioides sp. AE5 TaxID=2962573 RepID=UPI002881FE8B|nr:MBL fold metallo-hydrolase [Nocardioides sp. AE5]MDT0201856.1 MBL fold metallo-hydrolase [Nocardioides sp. AE5]
MSHFEVALGPTVQFEPGLYAIDAPFEDAPLTAYVITGRRLTVIDAGVVDTPKAHIAPALAKLGRSLSDIELAVVTHAHHDHIGGLTELRSANPRLEIAAAQAEARWIENTSVFLEENYCGYRPLYNPDEAFLERARRLKGGDQSVDRHLLDGDVIDIGDGHTLRIYSVPSHSAGHIAVLHVEADVLFTGDSLIARGHPFSRRQDSFPLYADVARYSALLDLYEELNPKWTATAHHGLCNRDQLRFLIRESRNLIGEIDDFLLSLAREKKDGLSLEFVVGAMAKHWPRYARRVSSYTTAHAHMTELVRRGHLRVTESNPWEWRQVN